jgi:aldehyde dehydrogenase (NAD+)
VLLGSNEVATAREEVFGPVITVIRAEGEEDALHIANDTEYGLSSAVLTRDMDRGAQFARRVEAGMGIGRFGGRWAVDKFTTHRWLSVQREPRAGSRSEGLP